MECSNNIAYNVSLIGIYSQFLVTSFSHRIIGARPYCCSILMIGHKNVYAYSKVLIEHSLQSIRRILNHYKLFCLEWGNSLG